MTNDDDNDDGNSDDDDDDGGGGEENLMRKERKRWMKRGGVRKLEDGTRCTISRGTKGLPWGAWAHGQTVARSARSCRAVPSAAGRCPVSHVPFSSRSQRSTWFTLNPLQTDLTCRGSESTVAHLLASSDSYSLWLWEMSTLTSAFSGVHCHQTSTRVTHAGFVLADTGVVTSLPSEVISSLSSVFFLWLDGWLQNSSVFSRYCIRYSRQSPPNCLLARTAVAYSRLLVKINGVLFQTLTTITQSLQHDQNQQSEQTRPDHGLELITYRMPMEARVSIWRLSYVNSMLH